MGVSTVISLISVLGVGLVLGACPTGWKKHAGSCYKFQLEILNWVEARLMCRMHKSDLIAIETPEEQAWFKKQVLQFNQTKRDDGFWLGATDWLKQNEWVWESANSAPVTYIVWGVLTNQQPGSPTYQQPNNRNGTEDCLAAMKFFEYDWSDEWCNWERLGYVCEMPAWRLPDRLKQHAGSCYKFQLEILNWVEARAMCKWHKSDLIAIETPEEQAWFKKQVLQFNQTKRDDGFWLGATDWLKQNEWVWESANSAPVNYIVWGVLTDQQPGSPTYQQPNNRNGTEDCLAAMKFFEYDWSDEWCNWERLGYVCEMPESNTPIVG